MSRSIALSLLAASLAVTSVSAHARVWTYTVGGTDANTADGTVATFVRSPPSNSPVKDLTSTDVRCNVNGATKAATSFSAAAGDVISPEWYHDNRGDDIIASSHVGPIVTYLAPAASNGEGDVWVKIAERGYSGGSWAVTDLIANGGKHDITLPSTLAPGDYLVRDEILALHEADTLYTANSARGIQLYPSCAQLTVTSGGTQDLPVGVSFPGAYTDATPGIEWSVYGSNDPSTYVIPGPAVWDGSASYDTAQAGEASSGSTTTTAAAQTASTAAVSTAATSTAAATSAEASSAVAASSAVVVNDAAESSAVAPTSTTPIVSATSTIVALSSAAAAVSPASSAAGSVKSVSSAAAAAATFTSVTQAAAGTTTTSAAVSEATDYSGCMRIYNKCLDASQPSPDFAGCQAALEGCTAGLNVKRMHRVVGAGHGYQAARRA